MWQQWQLKKIFGEVLWVSHFPILMAPTQAQESILSFILILKWWLIDKCLQSKSYNPSQDVYNFKGLKMRVTGFGTKINNPWDRDLFSSKSCRHSWKWSEQCGKVTVVKIWSLRTRISHQWAQSHALDQEYHCMTFKANWCCKGRKVLLTRLGAQNRDMSMVLKFSYWIQSTRASSRLMRDSTSGLFKVG